MVDIKNHFKYSNNELALKIGVSPGTIGNVLRNKVQEPRNDLYRRLEAGLSIKINVEDSTFAITKKSGELSNNQQTIQNYLDIEVENDMMEPELTKGNRISVDFKEFPEPNKLAVINLKSTRQLIGYVLEKNSLVVVWFKNSKYSPVILQKEEIKAIGRVRKIIKDV